MQRKAVEALLLTMLMGACCIGVIKLKVVLQPAQHAPLVVAVAHAKATAGAPTKPKGIAVSNDRSVVELTTKELCMV